MSGHYLILMINVHVLMLYTLFGISFYIQGGPKNGASVFHCKYFENSTTELHGSWWISAVLYVERSNYKCSKLHVCRWTEAGIVNAWQELLQSFIDRSINEWRRRL